MSFYDEYLNAVTPTIAYPPTAVQDNTGIWRAQDSWPLPDREVTLELSDSTYQDDASGSVSHQRSNTLENAVRVTGTPRMALASYTDAEVLVRLIDVAPDGRGVAIADEAAQIQEGEAQLEFKAVDWTLEAGHFLAVEIGSVSSLDTWVASPTGETVAVGATLTLPLDDPADDVATEGDPSRALRAFRKAHTVDLAELMDQEASFEL